MAAAPAASGRYRVAMVCSHAIQYLVPWFVHASGHPRLALTVLLGDEHGLVAGHDPEFGRAFRWDVDLWTGYRRIVLPNQAPRPGVGRFWGVASLEVFRELNKASYDAVVIQGWNYALYPLALLAARRAGLPVLMRAESACLPGEAPAATLRQRGKELILRRYLGACAGALAVSSGNRRLLLHYGMAPERVFCSPYAVDGERFQRSPAQRLAARQALQAQLGLPADPAAAAPPIVLFCGKLVPVKDPQLLLAAFAALRQGGTPAVLAVVGDGPLRDELQAWTRAHAVPDVHFLGFKNQSELPDLYAAADLLVLPSLRETFGVVVIEALHAGLPVIASDGVGCAEDLVLAGQTGLTFPRRDAAALTRCLQALCAGESGRARRLALAQGARARAASWTYAESTAGLVAALDALLGSAPLSR
jgi:glycosyltransferase involved in cell wall biosynthesis